MRRATAIETDLLQIQAEILTDRPHEYETGDTEQRSRASFIVFSSEIRGCSPANRVSHRASRVNSMLRKEHLH
jgi:hypothetical protein